jgi:hypothetical protein
MSVQDDLTQAQIALDTAVTAVNSAITDLDVPAVTSVGDQVLEAVLPVLTAAGYTVTPPAAAVSTDTAAPADSTDSASTDTSS